MAIVVRLDQYRHGFQECGLLRGQAVLALVEQLFHGGNHMVVLFLGLDGFDDDAIGEPGVFFRVDGQCSAHDFHAPFIYSLCVTMQRMNSTLRVKFISAMSRYLLPPMSKTTCGATESAVLNDCFTSAKLDQVARLATRYQWSMAPRACGCSSQKIRIALWLTTCTQGRCHGPTMGPLCQWPFLDVAFPDLSTEGCATSGRGISQNRCRRNRVPLRARWPKQPGARRRLDFRPCPEAGATRGQTASGAGRDARWSPTADPARKPPGQKPYLREADAGTSPAGW